MFGWKIKYIRILAVALFSFMLLGFGPDASSAGKVKISFCTWSPAPTWTETYQKLINAFEKEHPDIDVELVNTPGDSNCIMTILVRAAAGACPDVMQIPLFGFKDLARQGIPMDISDFIKRDKDLRLENFVPVALSAATYEGKLYGLPFDLGYQIMAYRPEVCEENGLQDPMGLWKSGEWTWESLRNVLKKVTKRGPDGKVTTIGMVLQVDEFSQQPWVYAAGGSFLNETHTQCTVDSDGVRTAINFLLGLEYQDRTMMGRSGDWWGSLLPKGGFAFWPQWCTIPTFLAQYDYSFDLIPYPRGPVKDVTTAQIHSIAISSQTKHPEAAWEFLKFMTAGEGIRSMVANNGYAPTRKELGALYIEAMKKRGIRGAACCWYRL